MTSYKSQYRNEIIKMMYVAGHTVEPSVETTSLIESIVRDETANMVATAGELASRRGQARFTANDLLFQVRHDSNRLARLRHLMRWHKLRKQAKGKESDNAGPEELNELIDAEDVDDDDDGGDSTTTIIKDDPAETGSNTTTTKHVALAQGAPSLPPLPWSTPFSFFFSSFSPPHNTNTNNTTIITTSNTIPLSITSLATQDDITSERQALQHKLERDDLRTRDMSAYEYNTRWSGARAASFTHKQRTRFRAWCGLGAVADHAARDDGVCVLMLGALAREWVQDLTERAMVVAASQEREEEGWCLTSAGTTTTRVGGKKRKREGDEVVEEEEARCKLRGGCPIEPRHVGRAFELLTTARKGYSGMSKGMRLGQGKRRRMF
ncbi:transcription initiation factor IID, 18kD subunit-domain-containing protein [Chaetomium strumarium]|uniref:Transcription initiation factor IID, 18kD subunit-domain-containing protein n=1 Tax=Chaetomium strumarium TaxID=1170767 RepID=A0AAJ0M3P7_9PEZI|nr:transcription initiation factor IID, 18kD subunit-domain-containing protein [Chaetomium strumarium]